MMRGGRADAERGPAPPPAISAHRGGGEIAPCETYEAYLGALEAGAEYVELDVRRTADGTLVACHGARARCGRAVAALSHARLCELAGHEVPRITEVLPLLAGRAAAHLDLKDVGCAAAVVRHAAQVLGPGGVIVTTGDARVAAMLQHRFPGVAVGLTAGGDLAEAAGCAVRRISRLDRVIAAGVPWAVLHHRLARAGAVDECRRRGIKTMVWTVNGERELERWLASPAVDVLVTERPISALALRGRRPQPGS